MVNGQNVDGEAAFQGRVLVKVVDDNLGNCVALDFDDDAGIFVGLITHGGDIRDDFFVHQLGNPLDQDGAVHIVRNGSDDDLLATAFVFLEADLAADFDAAAASLEIVFDARCPANDATGGEIRALNEPHQLRQCDLWIIYLGADAIDNFTKIMGRHVGG